MAAPGGPLINGLPTAMQFDDQNPDFSPQPPQRHTRVYQACIPCRQRKVKCDLGNVENPHDPPCARCARESKECYFSATRRKRKNDGSGSDNGEGFDYETRNGRKKLRADSVESSVTGMHRPEPLQLRGGSVGYDHEEPPRTPGGSVGNKYPLRRPTTANAASGPGPGSLEIDTKANIASSVKVLQDGENFGQHDALKLLYEAAEGQGDIGHHRTISSSSHSLNNGTSTPGAQYTGHLSDTRVWNGYPGSRPAVAETIDPFIGPNRTDGTAGGVFKTENDPGYPAAFAAWSRFRFVRAGWFTAKEAMAYIDYFYKYISPLTPVVVPPYDSYAKHPDLLEEEPMLVLTMLMIASRFAKFQGPGGNSRPHAIHEKLWQYLHSMISRTIWAQEQFGGGFCGGGAEKTVEINPLTRKGLRTLGTVESLLLLTEWHPRALHFPPGDDDQELMVPESSADIQGANGALVQGGHGGQSGSGLRSWLEPCWRSDRMCWMLLGIAMTLATELGVFEEINPAESLRMTQHHIPEQDLEKYRARKDYVKEVLLLFSMQLSGRLNLQSVIPIGPGFEGLTKTPYQIYRERTAKRKNVQETLFQQSMNGGQVSVDYHDLHLCLWMEMAAILDLANRELVPNRSSPRDMIKSGRYVQILSQEREKLMSWRQGFDNCKTMTNHMRQILSIEYEYYRVYLNSFALQAIVWRCMDKDMAKQFHPSNEDGREAPTSYPRTDTGFIAPEMLMKFYSNDRPYIAEVIDGSRNVLRSVVEELWPNDYLKHLPVRTYFRIVTVAIILLKTFTLGASEDDATITLGLMDRAVEALRTCIVDDVHVAHRFANLLEILTRNMRTRLVRLVPNTNGSHGASRSTTAPHSRQGSPLALLAPMTNNHLAPHAQWTGYQQLQPNSPGMQHLNNGNAGGRGTPSHPLMGISTEYYDPENMGDMCVMPPPSYGDFENGNGSGSGSNDVNGANAGFGAQQQYTNGPDAADFPAWFALPLNDMLAYQGADVTQTAYGPNVGDADMLDVLLQGGGTGEYGMN